MVDPTDMEYEDHKITRVKGDGKLGWEIMHSASLCFFVQADSPVAPQVGMTARFYRKGLGFPVRGLILDGKEVFYRTVAEQEAKHKQDSIDYDKKRKREFKDNRADMDARYDALPENFRRRLDKFRRNNPDFRWEYEGYELFTCEQAVLIAESLGTATLVKTFATSSWETQRELVPDLSTGHSGNTMGAACRLAYYHQGEPENVVKMHGALAPLVGSKEYGCVGSDG